jgi:FkbM family methyltransferase
MKFFDLYEIDEQIQIMDVGASAIAETPIYTKLMDLKTGYLNAFDGDERQIKKIRKAFGENVSIFNNFLFDGTAQNVYRCAPESGMTSLFKPKQSALQFFNGFESFGKVESIEEVQTERLDDIDNLPNIDFAKLDIQGAELTVLQNGKVKLDDCLAVQLEVSYVCLYENQPTFGVVDTWMRGRGYVPHCFLDVKKWSINPTIFNNNFRIAGNQLLESDIIYIRDPLQINELSDLQVKKMAVLSHYSMESIDLCAFLLLELERRKVIPVEGCKYYISNLNSF